MLWNCSTKTTTKVRTIWKCTDLFQSHGLSNYRSGGEFHANPIVMVLVNCENDEEIQNLPYALSTFVIFKCYGIRPGMGYNREWICQWWRKRDNYKMAKQLFSTYICVFSVVLLLLIFLLNIIYKSPSYFINNY